MSSILGDGDTAPGPRARVRRLPERARYDRATLDAILDEGFVCHLGFCSEGEPVVIPTAYARVGDAIYVHGAPANFALRRAVEGDSVCLTVTLVDGLVLARSAFHHSINYRSLVIFGVAHEVEDFEEKRLALVAFVDHVVPGRSRDTRPPSDSELRATRVVKVEIAEASAKVRDGGPKDEPEDLALTDIWAGELPFEVVPGAPVADASAPVTAPVPPYVVAYRRPGAAARDR
jgi:uncharacterized protein